MTTVQVRPVTPVTTLQVHRPIPLARIVTTELRKMVDTRSGFWLIAGIILVATLTTGSVILFADRADLTYGTFTAAISIPMSLILPVVAILSVTGEWSQRTGLTTFTLVPHRWRVVLAKAIASVVVAVVSAPIAFGIGALGNVLGAGVAGIPPVWDVTFMHLVTITLANVLCLMIGFMLGVLIRSSAAALAAYFVYALLLPTLSLILAAAQDWYRDLQPWVDFDFASGALMEGALNAQQWVHLGVTGLFWLVIPLAIGLAVVVRAEVK